MATDEVRPPRFEAIDLLRGFVMVLMVLDHTRDYFDEPNFDPTDLSRTTPAYFLTRWVTHFCAPVFVFLAGTGAYLYGRSRRPGPGLATFLVTRGLWLILLELTVVRFGLFFHPAPGFYFGLVFWAIGWSMVALGAISALPSRAVGLIGVALIAFHNLFDGVTPESLGAWRPLGLILHQPGVIVLPKGAIFLVGYPLIPWVGVMAAGYAFGEIVGLEPKRRRTVTLGLGLALTAAFLAARAANVYGDPRPWSTRSDPAFTALSFLNATKYPPSLVYLLMTLGTGLVLLAAFDRFPPRGAAGRVLTTLGRVPLFYFLLQWYVIHGLAVLWAAARGLPVSWLFAGGFPLAAPEGWSLGLPGVYAACVVVLALMYPACRWFAGVKARSRAGWLRYF